MFLGECPAMRVAARADKTPLLTERIKGVQNFRYFEFVELDERRDFSRRLRRVVFDTLLDRH